MQGCFHFDGKVFPSLKVFKLLTFLYFLFCSQERNEVLAMNMLRQFSLCVVAMTLYLDLLHAFSVVSFYAADV